MFFSKNKYKVCVHGEMEPQELKLMVLKLVQILNDTRPKQSLYEIYFAIFVSCDQIYPN